MINPFSRDGNSQLVRAHVFPIQPQNDKNPLDFGKGFPHGFPHG